MLLYRLIVLSWLLINNVFGGRKAKKQRVNAPLQPRQQNMMNPHQTMNAGQRAMTAGQRVMSAQQAQQRTVAQQVAQQAAQQAMSRQQRLPNPSNNLPPQRFLSPRPQSLRINQPPIRMHHPARPTHVRAHSKDLMSQVVASTLHHRRPDHPRKYVDYFDNGATWDHFMSKPESQNSEMNIDDSNFHVHLRYGGHDEFDEGEKLEGSHNMETYPGETISGENSLSKFMAPPVYDEYQENNFQRDRAEAEAEERFRPDTPEAAETEKLNTEQLVTRLNSLMTPLTPPFDSEGEKKTLNRASSKHFPKSVMRSKGGPSYGNAAYASRGSRQEQLALAREKLLRYGGRRENTEEAYNRVATETRGDERTRVAEKDGGEHYVNNMRGGGMKPYHGSREYQYYHRNKQGTPMRQEEEGEDGNEDGGMSPRNNERMAANLLRRRYHNHRGYEELYRERLMGNREMSAKHAYGRNDREDEHEESNENEEEKEEGKSGINLKSMRPENEFDSKYSNDM